MLNDNIYELPRIYVPDNLGSETNIVLSSAHTHYLKTQYNFKDGDQFRGFNGRNGEWLITLTAITQKSATALCTEQIRPQPIEQKKDIHLIFAPIKKDRQDILISKAVELGVTDLHPILTQNTETRRINGDRVHTKIIEASEKFERMNLAKIHTLSLLDEKIASWQSQIPIFTVIEKFKITQCPKDKSPGLSFAVLIGPEGGFTQDEIHTFENKTLIKLISHSQDIQHTNADFACNILSGISES